MRITDDYIFFWDGIYSQWYPADMIIDSITYTSCEQYMMQQKALLFGDKSAAKDIMNTQDPSLQKQIGRRVKKFDRDVWDEFCTSIVFKCNYAKFKQNWDLRKQLVAFSYGKIIVEASPYDKIWGIGMGENDPGIEDPANWRGMNLLGTCLMNVRTVLIKEGHR